MKASLNSSDRFLAAMEALGLRATEAGMGEIAKVAKSEVEGSAYYAIYEVQ